MKRLNKAKLIRELTEIAHYRYKDSYKSEYAIECFMDGVKQVIIKINEYEKNRETNDSTNEDHARLS